MMRNGLTVRRGLCGKRGAFGRPTRPARALTRLCRPEDDLPSDPCQSVWGAQVVGLLSYRDIPAEYVMMFERFREMQGARADQM